MKILVPIDFKKASYAAYKYANAFAHELNSELTLIHVLEGTFNYNDAISYEPILASTDKTLQRLRYFAEEYPKEQGDKLESVKIDYKVRFGIPGFTISDFANDKDFDLVIMGSRDKHGVFERLMGTSSSLTIKQTKCPVMLIHEATKYNVPDKIAFAFDAKVDLEDALERFLSMNDQIRARTEFVHVKLRADTNLKEATKEIYEELLEDHQPAFPFQVKMIEGKDVRSSLLDFCLFEKVDILALVHRHKGFFDEFLNRSISIRIAQNMHIPVIVFNEY